MSIESRKEGSILIVLEYIKRNNKDEILIYIICLCSPNGKYITEIIKGIILINFRYYNS